MARHFCKKNWEANKHMQSFFGYGMACWAEAIDVNIAQRPQEQSDTKVNTIQLLNDAANAFYFIWKNYNHALALHYHGCILLAKHDKTGNENDKKLAKNVFKFNWERNKNIKSLYKYAVLLDEGGSIEQGIEQGTEQGTEQDKEEARKLFHVGWLDHGNFDCLRKYINILRKSNNDADNAEVCRLKRYLEDEEENNIEQIEDNSVQTNNEDCEELSDSEI